jgi:hypothetical protein
VIVYLQDDVVQHVSLESGFVDLQPVPTYRQSWKQIIAIGVSGCGVHNRAVDFRHPHGRTGECSPVRIGHLSAYLGHRNLLRLKGTRTKEGEEEERYYCEAKKFSGHCASPREADFTAGFSDRHEGHREIAKPLEPAKHNSPRRYCACLDRLLTSINACQRIPVPQGGLCVKEQRAQTQSREYLNNSSDLEANAFALDLSPPLPGSGRVTRSKMVFAQPPGPEEQTTGLLGTQIGPY